MKKFLVIVLTMCVCLIAGAQETVQPAIPEANDGETVIRGNDPFGYRGHVMIAGGTFGPWSAPNEQTYIHGIRLNLGWGYYEETLGVDLGLMSRSHDAAGFQANLMGQFNSGDFAGFQIGLLNFTSETVKGVQVGFINYAERLVGVQIGILNVAESQWAVPLVNIAW